MFDKYLISQKRKEWKSFSPNECIFCKIASHDKDISRKEIWSNDKIMILLNIFPYTVGHLQVVPISHITTYRELLKTRLIFSINEIIEDCMILLSKTYNPDGYNIGLNLGRAAGNSIEHIHFHIVPRYYNQDIHGFMEVCADTKIVGENIDEALERLKHNSQGLFI